jgi:hypothetical protein
MKTVLKLGALGAAAAGAVVLVKRYDLVNRGVALANTAVDVAAAKAEGFVAKAVGITDDLLTRVAEKLEEEQRATNAAADDSTGDSEASTEFRTPGPSKMGYGDVHDGEGAGLR